MPISLRSSSTRDRSSKCRICLAEPREDAPGRLEVNHLCLAVLIEPASKQWSRLSESGDRGPIGQLGLTAHARDLEFFVRLSLRFVWRLIGRLIGIPARRRATRFTRSRSAWSARRSATGSTARWWAAHTWAAAHAGTHAAAWSAAVLAVARHAG